MTKFFSMNVQRHSSLLCTLESVTFDVLFPNKFFPNAYCQEHSIWPKYLWNSAKMSRHPKLLLVPWLAKTNMEGHGWVELEDLSSLSSDLHKNAGRKCSRHNLPSPGKGILGILLALDVYRLLENTICRKS